jgi:hypothetical protein
MPGWNFCWDIKLPFQWFVWFSYSPSRQIQCYYLYWTTKRVLRNSFSFVISQHLPWSCMAQVPAVQKVRNVRPNVSMAVGTKHKNHKLWNVISCYLGHAVAQWLRHCATSRKVAGSIPDGVTGIFHWHNPSGRTIALSSTQPLSEMSTRSIYWG